MVLYTHKKKTPKLHKKCISCHSTNKNTDKVGQCWPYISQSLTDTSIRPWPFKRVSLLKTFVFVEFDMSSVWFVFDGFLIIEEKLVNFKSPNCT